MSRFGGLSRFYRNFDWVLFIAVLVLTAIGLAAIYSVDLSLGGDYLLYFPTQVVALTIGFVILFLAASLHASFYRVFSRLIYGISALSLVAVLIFGSSIRGTRGWFRFAGFSFQPSELAKVALILFLAWLINRYGRRFERYKFVVSTGIFSLLFMVLIMLQPDLGSAIVLGAVWFGLMVVTGTRKRYILGILVLALCAFLVGWFFLFEDYQKERFLTFISPARDPLRSGYNVSQSLIAIGSGGFFGRGLGFGSQSQLHFLPEAQTDFIFSVIAEELGFVGVSLVLVLYMIIFWRLLLIARNCTDDFGAYCVIGILCVFFVQMIINIGGATGSLPVTGVTLPFLSYGGSSLIVSLFLIGIAESIARASKHST